MARWWCRAPGRTLCAAWLSLLLSPLLWQTRSSVSPLVLAAPACPRSCSCPSLREVHCTFRHLTTIPKNLPRDTERVNLGYNSLTEVEGSEFRSLRQLEMLMLHGNDISTVHHGAFSSLRFLQVLKLSYNKLTRVSPALLEGLVGLLRLHLDHNLIDFIEPYSFSGLTSLKLLQLEGNLLKDIHPHTFITVSLLGAFWTSGLRHLHLSDNLMEQLPEAALQTAPRLEVLSLHGNPWTCDCQLHWLLEWNSRHGGVIKCKKEREPGSGETCPQCASPQPLNGSLFLELSPDKLPCERPLLHSPLKKWDSPVWAESDAEPDVPYIRDLERPLGHLTFVLSDSHTNNAHVACAVLRPGESSPIVWAESLRSPAELSFNVSLVTVLECEIDRETLQNLWRLVAYYYESPAILERGLQRSNTTRVTYQYAQAVSEESPYFTDLKGYLMAEPSWLLQPRVTLQLNRRQTTNKKLVMDFTTLISKQIKSRGGREGEGNGSASSWALIRRGMAGRVRSILEGSRVCLECDVISVSSEITVEWMLPDLSVFEGQNDKMEISESGGLVILNTSISDSGLYHCMVRTKAGVDLVPMRLTVKEHSLSPTAFNGQKMIAEMGCSLSLPCKVTSAQPIQTLWYLPKNKILLPTQNTRRAEMMENGTLVLKKLTPDDAGEYSCMASNLYGVDMLSHIVEVTGEKESKRTNVQTDRKRTISLAGEEEGEGSGVDYQEIKYPSATESPRRIGTQQRNSGGTINGKRLKDFKRKPNKSVKELDRNRWAEILAKANAKATTALPRIQSITMASFKMATPTKPTTINTPAPPLATTTATTTTTTTATTITTNFPQSTGPDLTKKPVSLSANPTTAHHFATQTLQPAKQPENRRSGVGRGNWPNRRRPPYGRRRPPIRRVHPHQRPSPPLSKKPQTTVPQPTTTTTTTTTTEMASTTVRNRDYANANYHKEVKGGDDLDGKDEIHGDEIDIKDATELNSEFLHSTHDSDHIPTEAMANRENALKVISFSSAPNLPTPKSIPTPKPGIMPHPNKKIAEENENDFNGATVKQSEIDKDTETSQEDRNSEEKAPINPYKKAKEETGKRYGKEKESREMDKDKAAEDLITQSSKIQGSTHQINQSGPLPHLQPSGGDKPKIHAKTSPSRVTPSLKDVVSPIHPGGERKRGESHKKEEDQEVERSKAKPESSSFLITDPVHPRIHQSNQRTSSPAPPHEDQDRGGRREKGEEGKRRPEVGQGKQGKFSQPPRVLPTPYWPSYYHYYRLAYPSWPGQRSFPHSRKGPWSHIVPTYQPWLLPYFRVQDSRPTNRPEITAETVKPTAVPSGSSGNTRLRTATTPHPSHHKPDAGGGSHSAPGSRTQTRDHMLLSKLRNRYRQVAPRQAYEGKRSACAPHPHTQNM
ncbi:matrix-remodeling-associated protein 5 [Lampris incognitus]|uniref:matrix-remodeling-associated protein 5 n=1 Tax=Lampris incognitus TaxID=2546036 RepID=UPI0024B4F213|nr:matrix-remodeling-associated protein 5 [Lampris incognitus]